MKTHEDVFKEQVLEAFAQKPIMLEQYSGNSRGGVPDFFDGRRLDAVVALQRRKRRTIAEVNEEAALSDDEIDAEMLFLAGLLSDAMNKFQYKSVERDIFAADKLYKTLLNDYKNATDVDDIRFIIRRAVTAIEDCLSRGCNTPRDFFFMRRFGLYG